MYLCDALSLLIFKLSVHTVVITSRKFRRLIVIANLRAAVGVICRRHASTTRTILCVLVEQLMSTRREGAVLIRIFNVLAVGICVAVASRFGVAIILMVIHIDSLVGFLIVRRHGESRLVWVNVAVAATELSVIISRKAAMEFPVRERVATDEGGSTKQEAVKGGELAECHGVHCGHKTYQTNTPRATTPLLTLHTCPQRPDELYAACVAKADNQMIVKTTSTASMA